jgi:hypothetical protein
MIHLSNRGAFGIDKVTGESSPRQNLIDLFSAQSREKISMQATTRRVFPSLIAIANMGISEEHT